MDYNAHHEISPRLNSQGLHAHDFYEFYFHVKGGRLYCVDDKVFELKPCQLIIIPPMHMHGLVCDRDLVDYERCWLYLTPEMLRKLGLGKLDLIKLFDTAYENQNFTDTVSETDTQKIIENIREIELNLSGNKKNAASAMQDYSDIIGFLGIVCKALNKDSVTEPVMLPSNSENAMPSVLHYINGHYTQNISIQDMCGQFGMSESSLSHDFRKYTNKSVYEYILYKRIIHAKELIFTDLTLTQISLECGFNDYSNFLRVFRKIAGCSPKEYRKQKNNSILT